MNQYPHIEYWKKAPLGEQMWAFEKYDGSLIRIEWNKKLSKQNISNGFNKFGTKKQLIDRTNTDFGSAIDIFMNKYSTALDEIFRTDKEFRNTDKFTAYCEFFGKNSFAGWHDPTDKKDLKLFDIDMYKRGLITPKLFISKFEKIDIANLIYQGNLNKEFINDIFNGNYNVDEGVVCKGIKKAKGQDIVWMCKCKTKAWIYRVKGKYGDQYLKDELNGDLTLIGVN